MSPLHQSSHVFHVSCFCVSLFAAPHSAKMCSHPHWQQWEKCASIWLCAWLWVYGRALTWSGGVVAIGLIGAYRLEYNCTQLNNLSFFTYSLASIWMAFSLHTCTRSHAFVFHVFVFCWSVLLLPRVAHQQNTHTYYLCKRRLCTRSIQNVEVSTPHCVVWVKSRAICSGKLELCLILLLPSLLLDVRIIIAWYK